MLHSNTTAVLGKASFLAPRYKNQHAGTLYQTAAVKGKNSVTEWLDVDHSVLDLRIAVACHHTYVFIYCFHDIF